MHENEYAYAVARIRANEVNLLTPAETEQLISAESYEAALRLLGDKAGIPTASVTTMRRCSKSM